jgi:hypothetical protein
MEKSGWLTFVSSFTQANAVVTGGENSAVIVGCFSCFVSPAQYLIP